MPRIYTNTHDLTPQQIERFYGLIKKAAPDECWIYEGSILNDYGRYNYKKGRSIQAHRLAYYLHYHTLPNLNVLHRCDNPPCCNPSHLFLGTDADNVADKVAKGRQAKGDKHGSITHQESRPRGEQHGMAKLTDTIVGYIKGMLRGIKGEQSQLAKRAGISKYTISLIAKEKIWKHIAPTPLTKIPAPFNAPIMDLSILKTHCKRGHLLPLPENCKRPNMRSCRPCQTEWTRLNRRKRNET